MRNRDTMKLDPVETRAKSDSNIRESLPCRNIAKDRVIINVGGYRHETYLSTLRVVPDSRLAWIAENASKIADYDPENNEYFFDRHPGVFVNIINYYRTGKLHCPSDVCGPLFEEELAFWGIDELQMEPCCWSNYTQHRDAQETLKAFEGLQKSVEESENENTAFTVRRAAISRTKWKPEMWAMLEQPYSSKYAQIFALVSLVVIVLSVATFCLESIKALSNNYKDIFDGLEYFYLVWFTADFIARFLCCPSKVEFFKTFMTWVDIMSVVPLYVNFVSKKVTFLFVLRLIRIFRLFRFFRTMSGMQVIGHTLRASARELLLLVLILTIPMVIFSTLVYHAEQNKNGAADDFQSIPESFWWAVITMTTVGYGDVYPRSPLGKIIGTVCACVGVLIVALPVSVIGSNFTLFYSHAQAQLKLPRKKRTPLLLGAAGALVSESTLYNNDEKSESSDDGVGNTSPRDESFAYTRKSTRNPSITPRCRAARREAVLPCSTLSALESDTSDVEPTSQTKKSAEELFSSPPTAGSGIDITSGLLGVSDVMLHITAPSHRRMAISPAPSPPFRRNSQRKRRRGGSKRSSATRGQDATQEKEHESYYCTTTDGDSPVESGAPDRAPKKDRNGKSIPEPGGESSNESNTSVHKKEIDDNTEDETRIRPISTSQVNLRGVRFDSPTGNKNADNEPARSRTQSVEVFSDNKDSDQGSDGGRVRSKSELTPGETPPTKRRNAITGNRKSAPLPISPLVRSDEKLSKRSCNGSLTELNATKSGETTENAQGREVNKPVLLHNRPGPEGGGDIEIIRPAARRLKRDAIQNMTRV